MNTPAIVWFRDDLRIADNPALAAAIRRGGPILCVYLVQDAQNSGHPGDNPTQDSSPTGPRARGAAARWYLHQALGALGAALAARGGRLDLYDGPVHETLSRLIAESGAGALYWNRRYAPAAVAEDEKNKQAFAGQCEARSFNGALLFEPWEIRTGAGAPYRVFSPFWRAARAKLPGALTLAPEPGRIDAAPAPSGARPLAAFGLTPAHPNWAHGFGAVWRAGETAARARLTHFIDAQLERYPHDRDRPDADATSGLSAALTFGEISPRQIAAAVLHAMARRPALGRAGEKFLSEIGWREFSYGLLFQAADLAQSAVNPAYDSFPWRDPARARDDVAAWWAGRTGYPIVDAGMRQLWATGVMHNRVRMIVASFLVKHLLIDWRVGERWFWNTLCDADAANNPASWQWVAGAGADAAPYFRIFNPILQGETFDPDGRYVKRWVPQLAHLPAGAIHKPWSVGGAPDYPAPIVDHAAARARALAALAAMREGDANAAAP